MLLTESDAHLLRSLHVQHAGKCSLPLSHFFAKTQRGVASKDICTHLRHKHVQNCQPDNRMCCMCWCQSGNFQAMIQYAVKHIGAKLLQSMATFRTTSDYPPNLGSLHLRQQIFRSFPACSSARESQCCVGHWCYHWGHHWGYEKCLCCLYDSSTSRIISHI